MESLPQLPLELDDVEVDSSFKIPELNVPVSIPYDMLPCSPCGENRFGYINI
jgi:hypothetical protein